MVLTMWEMDTTGEDSSQQKSAKQSDEVSRLECPWERYDSL